MKYVERVIVESDVAHFIRRMQSMTGDEIFNVYGLDNGTILSHTVYFKDGMQANINLIAATGKAKNYTECTLTTYELEQVDKIDGLDDFFGKIRFRHNGNEYIILVEEE